MELYREVRENAATQDGADTKAAEIFAFFDEVRVRCASSRLPGCGGLVAIGFPMLIYIAISTGLREMEGASFGGCAGVDDVDCRDSERR